MRSTRAEKEIARTRCQPLIDGLSDLLTGADGPTSEQLSHYSFVAGCFGTKTSLDRYLMGNDAKPMMKRELLIALLIETLSRL